jgi:hypothetical protein
MRYQSLVSNLRKLQRAQHRHDQVAHQDIAGRSVPKRVTHFTLHFSKYVGGLAKAIRKSDEQQLRRLITDTFVITLAAANAMNVDLQRRIAEAESRQALDALALDSQRDLSGVVLRYAEVVGEMSKACEALDHMEDFPSRKTQEKGVVLLLSIVCRLAELAGMDLAVATKERWKSIEQKPVVTRDESSTPDAARLSRVA